MTKFIGIFYNDTDVYNAIRKGNVNDTFKISSDGVTNLTMDEGIYQIVNASDKDAKFPAGRGYTNNDGEYAELRELKGIKKIGGGQSEATKSEAQRVSERHVQRNPRKSAVVPTERVERHVAINQQKIEIVICS